MPPALHIDHHNGVPAYRQLMEQLKLQIATGVLTPGTEMASTRALSTQLSLNPMTISKAYSLLEHEGVLERRRGQTLVVRERTEAETQTSRREPLIQQLQSAAQLARQLEIGKEEALNLFKKALNQTSSQ